MLTLIHSVEASTISTRKSIIGVSSKLRISLYGADGIALISTSVPVMVKDSNAESNTSLGLQSYLLSFEYKRAFLLTRISLVLVLVNYGTFLTYVK
jgi:hypothetical protein